MERVKQLLKTQTSLASYYVRFLTQSGKFSLFFLTPHNYAKVSVFKFLGLTLLIACLKLNHANAQQQLWASQYVSWKFDNSLEVWNIDQLVWLPVTSDQGYWPLQWSWRGGHGVGGYMGLQQGDDSSKQQVRFSLWNAMAAKGQNCQRFSGEGIGYSCVLPITINNDALYRIRLWRLQADKDGQWWGGWISEFKHGKFIEHNIGQIKVPLAYKVIDPSTISNFVEYFGTAVKQCNQVPFSVVGFSPPAVNYQGDESRTYGGYSTYVGSQRATENICYSGKETRGALVTTEPYDFGFAKGVMVFLGGANKQPRLNQ